MSFPWPEWLKSRPQVEREKAKSAMAAVRGLMSAEMEALRRTMKEVTERERARDASD